MIYISAHKDFNLKIPEGINYNKFSIIDGGELVNDYPINIIHETDLNNDIYYDHDSWGELTRMYYIYKNINTYNDDIIGFIQYRRMFNDHTLLNYESILNDYDIICSTEDQQFGIFNNYGEYSCGEMELAIRLISFFMPKYKKSINLLYKNTKMICHNMFIMKKYDFMNYCDFIFTSLKLLYNTLKLDSTYHFNRIKTLSIVAERLSHLFFIHNFNKIYYSPVIYY